MTLDGRLNFSFWALRVAIGASAIGFGVEQFNRAGTWTRLSGVMEVLAGMLIFTLFSQRAATFLSGWWLLLALDAVTPTGDWVLGVCQVMLASGAFSLAGLIRLNEAASTTRPRPGRAARGRVLPAAARNVGDELRSLPRSHVREPPTSPSPQAFWKS